MHSTSAIVLNLANKFEDLFEGNLGSSNSF